MYFKKLLPVSIIATCSFFSYAEVATPERETQAVVITNAEHLKQQLRQKLDKNKGFSSMFKQLVLDNDGNVLQQSQGKLVVKRPNLIYWETQQPDETLVISDGHTLWFYNPFVEQVSAFSISNAVTNTPILLLSDTSKKTWQDYQVSLIKDNEYEILSLNDEAQVKSLKLVFANDTITAFTIVDATGQTSQFDLSNVVTSPLPNDNVFTFELPAGVDFDDQR
ncbi:outer membrane lipoprotein chaperone LolA [Thalassotalea aquiviva]|uniref:outer membrane lipoprotein chaperone LolA n=1 Tax=Thalassotalea aquiviva TaxID=3242415 RepID=UPI00352A8F4B